MTEEELLQWIRVRVTPTHILVEVRMPEGLDTPTPTERWSMAGLLRRSATEGEVKRARLLALADYRYFRTCDACGEKLPSAYVQPQGDGTDACRDCLG